MVVLVWGNVCSIILMDDSSWGARSSDDIVTFRGGVRHGRCARAVTGGVETRVLDDFNTRSLIHPGHESSAGSAQLIRR